MIKAIVFDWGGVLGVDNNVATAEMLASRHGLSAPTVLQKLEDLEAGYFVGQPAEEYYKSVADEFGISAHELRQALNAVPAGSLLSVAKNITGIKKYILSNQIGPRTESIRRMNDLSFFDGLYFSNEIGVQKPNREAFEYVINEIGVTPQEILFVDDWWENVDAAREAGMQAVIYRNLDEFVRELRSREIKV